MTTPHLCALTAFCGTLYAAGADGLQHEPVSSLLIAIAVAAIVGKLASIYTIGARP